MWQREFGNTVAVHGSGAGGNGNGVVDALDLVVWQDNFGKVGPNPSAVAVSEPEPWLIYIVLGVCLYLGRPYSWFMVRF